MRNKALVLIAIAIMAAVTMQTASAAARTHVSIRFNHTTERFHGKVRSPNSECMAGRTVKLFKKTATGRVLQGKDRSGRHGHWRIEVMHAHGHYFAKVPRQKIMHTTCGRARSRTLDVM